MFNFFKPRKEEISPGIKAIVDNIKNNPRQWRVHDGRYFFNREKRIVFWILCGLNLNNPQLIHIFKAYIEWHDVFAKINMEEKLPVIKMRISDHDEE